jgi:hypothetical protein
VFSWEGAHGSRLQGEGLTRDISLSGAFLLSPTCPPAKAAVRLDIFLPPLHNGAPRVRIQAEAQVVRVDSLFPENGGCGFAVVSITGFNFAPASPGEVEALSNLAEKLEEIGGKT